MATVLIVIGVLTGALGLLDIFLSRSQKDKLDAWTLRLWDWLSDARKVSILKWAVRSKFRISFFTLATAAAVAAGTSFSDQFLHDQPKYDLFFILASAAGIGIALGWRVLRFILDREPVRAPVWAIAIFLLAFPIWFLAVAGASSFGLIAFIWVYYVGLTTQVYLFVALLPLLVIMLVQALLFISEIVVRRIAESPKGVVMSASGLATAIGSALKALA